MQYEYMIIPLVHTPHTSPPPHLTTLPRVEMMLYSVALSSPVLISSRKRARRPPMYLWVHTSVDGGELITHWVSDQIQEAFANMPAVQISVGGTLAHLLHPAPSPPSP